jgi:hypothetical protein
VRRAPRYRGTRGGALEGRAARYLEKLKQMSPRERRPGDGERVNMNATATIAPAGAAPASGAGGPQYMRALERANKVRLARADLKRKVATGEMSVAEIVLECPWEAESMSVADLLMSQRRWGVSRCRKFLAQIPMSETKTVGTMTDRQRRTLAAMLKSRTQRSAIERREEALAFSP